MMSGIGIEKRVTEACDHGQTLITEVPAKQIFKAVGIPVVEERTADTPETACLAAEEIGFPVVLKGVGPGLAHKTEKALVEVGLANGTQVADAARNMAASAGKDLSGFVVQPVVNGRRELVAGMFTDPQFGPVIMVGLGGVFTEALEQIVLRVAPLTPADLDDMVESFPAKSLLGPFRGEAPCDTDALKAVLSALSDLAMAEPRIREIDINPLIIQPSGGLTAVDGLIGLTSPDTRTVPPPPRIDVATLGACFYPESIAFVGASATPGKWGHMLPTDILSRPYKGKVFLVNPKGGKILGRPVYRSMSDIPGPVDLAVVTIPARYVTTLIPELAAKQVKGMLLITSGFREIGPLGAALEAEVTDAARGAGILLLGPNTMGMCNPHADLYCSASHAHPMPGSTALVSQSGNMGTQLLTFAEQQDIGIRAFSGSGNEAMVTIEDYMEAFEVDTLTRTVMLYLESVKDGRRFFTSARRVSVKKPVVVLNGGRTPNGRQAAASHTGAMASDVRVFEAVCRQTGIIRVDQPMELLDLSAALSSLPLPRGNRVAVMTLGGGWGVIATDLCSEYGLDIPPLPDTLVRRFDTILPEFWSHGNPIDLVGEGDPEIPKTCLAALLEWEGCDAVIHLGIHGRRVLVNNMARSILNTDPDVTQEQADTFKQAMLDEETDYIRFVVEMTETYGKPVLGVSLLTDKDSRTLYRCNTVSCNLSSCKAVFFPSPERAVKALAGMCQYQNWRDRHSG